MRLEIQIEPKSPSASSGASHGGGGFEEKTLYSASIHFTSNSAWYKASYIRNKGTYKEHIVLKSDKVTQEYLWDGRNKGNVCNYDFKIQIKLNQISQVKQHSHTDESGGLMVQALRYWS